MGKFILDVIYSAVGHTATNALCALGKKIPYRVKVTKIKNGSEEIVVTPKPKWNKTDKKIIVLAAAFCIAFIFGAVVDVMFIVHLIRG